MATKPINGAQLELSSRRRIYGREGGFYVPHARSATWYTGELVDPKTGELYTPPSRTKQEFVKECDINNIIKSYRVTGQVRHISAKAAQGAYTDLPDPIDFQDALNLVIQAEESFSTLPSQVRDRFGNDPERFLRFMSDPANADEMVKLGLATQAQAPADDPAPAPDPAPSAGAGGTGG